MTGCVMKPPAAGLTVDEAMDCLLEHMQQYGPDFGPHNMYRLGARLTAAIEQKNRKP